jgi:hypothetical protein
VENKSVVTDFYWDATFASYTYLSASAAFASYAFLAISAYLAILAY